MIIARLRTGMASHGYPLLISLIVALLIGGVYSIVEPIAYTNDTGGYLEGARWFAHYPGGKYPYWRTPLYMIMMALTGAAQGWTLKLLVLLQDLLALLIPLLIYFTLAWINRWIACLISVSASISLIPFVNSGYVMPNLLYGFFVFLTVTCSAYYFHTKKPGLLYAMGLLCFATVMTRPQGAYLYLVFFAATFLYQRTHFKHWITALAMLLLLQTGYMAIRPHFVQKIGLNYHVLINNHNNIDFIPSDMQLFDRSMVFLASDLYSDARFFLEMIQTPVIKSALEFAIINRQLLKNKPMLAIDTALAISDAGLRNEALSDIYFYTSNIGAHTAAMSAIKLIDDPLVRSHLNVSTSKQYLPIDYSQLVPLDEGIAPKRYVNGLDLTNSSGRMLLYQVLNLRNFFPQAVLNPSDGGSTRLLFRLVEAYWASHPEIMKYYPALWAFKGDPQEAARYMLTGFEYKEAQWTLWMMMDDILGPEQGDKLCLKVYLEFLRANFHQLMSYYEDNFFKNIWQISGATMFFSHSDVSNNPRFSAEIAQSQRFSSFYTNPTVLQDYSNMMLAISKPLSITAVVLVIFLLTNGTLLRMWLMLWGIVVHQIAICVLTAGAMFAYVAFSYLFILMAFGLGLCGLLVYWHKLNLQHARTT